MVLSGCKAGLEHITVEVCVLIDEIWVRCVAPTNQPGIFLVMENEIGSYFTFDVANKVVLQKIKHSLNPD